MLWLKTFQENMLKDIWDFAQAPQYISNPSMLQVYSRGYFSRLHEIFSKDFPITQWALGESRFYEISRAFFKRHPSMDYNINRLSYPFFDYIREHPNPEFPWLAEIVRFEVHQISTSMKPEYPKVDLTSIGNLDPEDWNRAVFSFQPYLELQETSWSIHKLQQAYEDKKSDPRQYLLPEQDCFVFYRLDEEQHFAKIPQEEFQVLRELHRGITLGEALETQKEALGMNSLSGWFSHWHQLGFITDIRLTEA